MAKTKEIISSWGKIVVVLSLLLFLFTVPHTLEDFATGEPAKAGFPAPVISYVISGMFALQALALFWAGRQMRRSYIIHAFVGLFWLLAASAAQLPTILSGNPYRAGFISVFYVGGMIVIGFLLFIVSVLAMRTGTSR
ncbi:MAG TPA: hypothetical protein VLA72_09095 [Anaerolineales bacterium]|nr:hypothetical protein [Anaerolineales bacterium]